MKVITANMKWKFSEIQMLWQQIILEYKLLECIIKMAIKKTCQMTPVFTLRIIIIKNFIKWSKLKLKAFRHLLEDSNKSRIKLFQLIILLVRT